MGARRGSPGHAASRCPDSRCGCSTLPRRPWRCQSAKGHSIQWLSIGNPGTATPGTSKQTHRCSGEWFSLRQNLCRLASPAPNQASPGSSRTDQPRVLLNQCPANGSAGELSLAYPRRPAAALGTCRTGRSHPQFQRRPPAVPGNRIDQPLALNGAQPTGSAATSTSAAHPRRPAALGTTESDTASTQSKRKPRLQYEPKQPGSAAAKRS